MKNQSLRRPETIAPRCRSASDERGDEWALPRELDRSMLSAAMTPCHFVEDALPFDAGWKMSPEQIRAGTCRLAWVSPVMFVVMLVIMLKQDVSGGYAFLIALATVAAPWILAIPIIVWGQGGIEGMRIVAAILRIFED
jgi:hypothetical protein